MLMKLVNSFKIKLIKNKLEILVYIIIVLSIAVGTIVYFLPIAKEDNILYLLSSISQGLAAILALVFVIAIFGAQVMQKFTAMDKIMDKWTQRLMILFSIGILLPLIQLETDYDVFNDLLNLNFDNTAKLSLAIDLSIATICVLAVIPYLMKVNRIMKYEGGVSKLSDEIYIAIDSNQERIARNNVRELAKLGISAAEEMLENKTIEIIDTYLRRIGIEVTNIGWGSVVECTKSGLIKIGLKCTERELDGVDRNGWRNSPIKIAIKAIRELEVEAIEKFKDYNISKSQNTIEILTTIGTQAIDNDLSDDTIYEASIGLSEIGVKVTGNRLLINSVFDGLVGIPNKAYKKDQVKFKKTIEQSLISLWIICASENKYDSQYTKTNIYNFKAAKSQVIIDLFGSEEIRGKARKYIKEKYPQLESELKTFEELYDAFIL